MHPATHVDRFHGRQRVVPVAQHHAVATSAELTDLPAQYDFSSGVDDLAFQVRLGSTNGGHAQL
ncbi:hypothetical protein D3C71_1391210 [compost metagenome]